MLKQIYSLLNLAVLTILALNLGNAALTIYQHITYVPSEYDLVTSAPWYLGIELGVFFSLIILVPILIARFIIGRKLKKNRNEEEEE